MQQIRLSVKEATWLRSGTVSQHPPWFSRGGKSTNTTGTSGVLLKQKGLIFQLLILIKWSHSANHLQTVEMRKTVNNKPRVPGSKIIFHWHFKINQTFRLRSILMSMSICEKVALKQRLDSWQLLQSQHIEKHSRVHIKELPWIIWRPQWKSKHTENRYRGQMMCSYYLCYCWSTFLFVPHTYFCLNTTGTGIKHLISQLKIS